jgi:signal transduction histidine kinase
MRSRFARRIAVGFGIFFVALFATSGLIGALVSGGFHPYRHRPFGPLVGLLALVLLVGLAALWRSVRRTAAPVGEVMQAADRVAAGDYTATVDPRGVPEMRRLARAFNTMTERLRTDEERRRQLFADIAHELRTPLSVIQGNVEGILDGVYAPDPERLQTVLEETRVASRLLEDLRTLSTAEAGALELHLEPAPVRDLVDECVSALGAMAEAKGIALSSDVAEGIPALNVDRIRIGEVLSNVVSNAIRETPAGGSVTVSASARETDAVEFRVADTGPGIDPEVASHVFDRFVKSKGSRGAGLGLAIARTLVEAHGGTIAAQSGEGGGTTVTIVLSVRHDADADGPV